MLYSQDRNQLRMVFFQAWEKHQQAQPLDTMETILVNIIGQHPEYHSLLSEKNKNLDKDYNPEMGETNPFLHLSMHIAIHEQLSIDQPAGIKEAYQKLLNKLNDSHEVEHHIMECLGEMIWKSQKYQTMPDQVEYINCIKKQL